MCLIYSMTVFLWLSVVLVVTIGTWVTIIIRCQYQGATIITIFRCQPGVSAGQCVTSWPQLLQCGLRYVTGKYSTLTDHVT